MNIRLPYIVLFLFSLAVFEIHGQPDNDPPESPVLNLVSVDPLTGDVEISWSPSSSPDVSGYVVYLFQNGAGDELDTIYNPAATSYLRTASGSGYKSESFVVAALDTADNISPLSNVLSTIFITAQIDTCKKEITIDWNSYSSFPRQVLGYTLLCSVNGGSYKENGRAGYADTTMVLNDFEVDAQYCFFIRADLEGGYSSGSNKTCIFTKMQRTPDWINADYATVNPDKQILLSFTVDPLSEIRTFRLDRKTGSTGIFSQIHQFSDNPGQILFTDSQADPGRINYYRLTALNNCSLPIKESNIASNMVLSLERNETEIELSWNPYRKWEGMISSYRVYAMTSQEMEEIASPGAEDTVLIIDYNDLMYDVSRQEICFMIGASETANPYGISGESNSQIVCTPITERITVPTLFTPDNNTVNDFFRPVLSFTPLSYKLIITDLKRKIVFETSDHAEEWDGTINGNLLPEGVYLWFLRTRSPSGKDFIRSGSVTIIHNR